ncbi:transmembrane protein 26 isoform X2 [Nematostella vectensis]|nr:transmembrane protein 26 isoform X2 [Nematostella vectensis]
MFLYLLAVIPCDWITKRAVINCIVESKAQANPELCQKAISSNVGQALGSVYKSQDDEAVLYTLEQALVLILVIGRWLLPKGSISRDQLSQLLLVYVGMAADIMEFTEIIKEDEIRKVNMLNNNHFVNAVILFWSMSLFQFTLTISGTERTAQRLEKEKAKIEEELHKVKESEKTRKRNRVGPALYATKVAESQEKNEIRLKFIQTKNGLEIKPDIPENDVEKAPETNTHQLGCMQKLERCYTNMGKIVNEYIELVSLLVPMLMQDGPFLIIRLIAIAYYEVNHDTLYFLTVKNALVIMLQIYRIFVLYYKPPQEDPDIFAEFARKRLSNVQTAIRGVQNTRLAIRLVSRLQKQARRHKARPGYKADGSKYGWERNTMA